MLCCVRCAVFVRRRHAAMECHLHALRHGAPFLLPQLRWLHLRLAPVHASVQLCPLPRTVALRVRMARPFSKVNGFVLCYRKGVRIVRTLAQE